MNLTANRYGHLFYHHIFYALLKETYSDKIYAFKRDYPEYSSEYQHTKKEALEILKKEEKHTIKRLDLMKKKEVS